MAPSSLPSFSSLAEEFVYLLRTQPGYTVEKFADRYPQWTQRILDELPAVVFAEELRGMMKQCYDSPTNIPKKVDAYTLDRRLGSGGMGVVYSAHHTKTGEIVAIKLIPFEKVDNPTSLGRFQIEAGECSALVHPNIVPIYDYGFTESFAYIVMRKLNGVGFDEVIDRLHNDQCRTSRAPDWRLIANYIAQAASALDHAHNHGFVHRDIKPANLFLEDSARVFITDFGLAKILNYDVKLSMTGDIIGTPRYMAPEQFRGSVDSRSDIYSLGVTLYEVLCGDELWKRLGDQALVSKRSLLDFPDARDFNPLIPGRLAEIVKKACAIAPEERFQTAAEFAAELRSWVVSPHENALPCKPKTTTFKRNFVGISLAVAALTAFLSFTALNNDNDFFSSFHQENAALDLETFLRSSDSGR